MSISAQVAIYPLRQPRLAPAIDLLTNAFTAHGLSAEVGAMSTTVCVGVPTPSSKRSGMDSPEPPRSVTS